MHLAESVEVELPTLKTITVNGKTGSPVKLGSRLGHPDAGVSQYLAQKRAYKDYQAAKQALKHSVMREYTHEVSLGGAS